MPNGTPRIVPEGNVPAGAVKVERLRFLKEARFCGPGYSGKFLPGDTADVPGSVPESVAFTLLDPNDLASRHDAGPRVEIVDPAAGKPVPEKKG